MSRSTIPSKRSADAQEEAWIADEDRFVLQQSKKKAAIRVKSGRAQPIDWLAVTLAVIDPVHSPLDDEVEEGDIDLVDPETVFGGLDDEQLAELERGIDTYMTLESSKSNRDYWNMMKAISADRIRNVKSAPPGARGVSSVASDLDKLLGPKTLDQLEKLEGQITTKLASNEPIDTDYWEHLLRSLRTYKAKAKLRKLSQSILDARMDSLRKQQAEEASSWRENLQSATFEAPPCADTRQDTPDGRHPLDPEPLLRLRPEDKALDATDPATFASDLADSRRKVVDRGYIPQRKRTGAAMRMHGDEPASKRQRVDEDTIPHSAGSLFDREVARGLSENEEVFAAEVPVETKGLSQWSSNYRPRKPQYFNRMRMGYEWNKYNQTHYDHDNPPPKVVQGFKFNIFYPDLVDNTKAPTYRIERENGRKRGELSAPAGEDDTCVIRFTAGPPYEDIAFRIVDKEWDYSAKRERGFRSRFDKGILQLYFQFKKIYYRK